MASSTLDFPDPVGPHSANRSRPLRSSSCSSRKAVKPFIRSRTGLILGSHILVHPVERAEELGRRLDPVRMVVVGRELLARRLGPEHFLARGLVAFVFESNLERVRKEPPDYLGDPRRRAVDLDGHAQVVIIHVGTLQIGKCPADVPKTSPA